MRHLGRKRCPGCGEVAHDVRQHRRRVGHYTVDCSQACIAVAAVVLLAAGGYLVGDGRRDTQSTPVLVAAHPVIREADPLRAQEILHAHGRALMVLGEYGAAREVLGRAGRPPLGSSRFPSRASPSWTSGGRRPEAYAGGIEAVRRGDGQANEHCLVTLALIEAGLGQERDCREHAR